VGYSLEKLNPFLKAYDASNGPKYFLQKCVQ
jgi:cytochrome c